MSYKWDESAPYPGYKTIAKKMGVSHKSARRDAQSLEQKGYLRRQVRVGATNRFELKALVAAVEKKLTRWRRKRRKQNHGENSVVTGMSKNKKNLPSSPAKRSKGFRYTGRTDLTPEEKLIEDEVGRFFAENLPALIREYRQRFGHVIDRNNAQELYVAYGYLWSPRWGQGTNPIPLIWKIW